MAKVNLPGDEVVGDGPKIPDLPNNSFAARRAQDIPERKKLDKVANTVRHKKPGIGRRIKDDLLSDETPQSIWGYIWEEVLVPAAKDTLSDMITQGVEMLLFGETRSPTGARNRPGTASRVSYERYYKRDDRPVRHVNASRERYRIDDIILASRGEASLVIDTLQEQINQYEAASVADLYDLVDIEEKYTDHKWGWTDLRNATISRVREGYLLNLPRPTQLD